MKNEMQKPEVGSFEMALIEGNLSKLTSEQRLAYYKSVCESLGLNPLTNPFAYIQFQGRLQLYAKKDCTEQLRKIHKIALKIVEKQKIDDVFIVTAEASLPDGRTDSAIGAVDLKGLKGDALANAMMKAETKAKRRVTLSVCGLGILDESEIETIKDAKVVSQDVTKRLQEAPKVEPKFEIHDHVEETVSLGEIVCNVGKRFKGKKIKEIEPQDLADYIRWFDEEDAKGSRLSDPVREFAMYSKAYVQEVLNGTDKRISP